MNKLIVLHNFLHDSPTFCMKDCRDHREKGGCNLLLHLPCSPLLKQISKRQHPVFSEAFLHCKSIYEDRSPSSACNYWQFMALCSLAPLYFRSIQTSNKIIFHLRLGSWKFLHSDLSVCLTWLSLVFLYPEMQTLRIILATLGGAISSACVSSTLVHANELVPTVIRYDSRSEQIFLSLFTIPERTRTKKNCWVVKQPIVMITGMATILFLSDKSKPLNSIFCSTRNHLEKNATFLMFYFGWVFHSVYFHFLWFHEGVMTFTPHYLPSLISAHSC